MSCPCPSCGARLCLAFYGGGGLGPGDGLGPGGGLGRLGQAARQLVSPERTHCSALRRCVGALHARARVRARGPPRTRTRATDIAWR